MTVRSHHLRVAATRAAVVALAASGVAAVPMAAGAATTPARTSTQVLSLPAAPVSAAATTATDAQAPVRASGPQDVHPFSMLAVTWRAGTATSLDVQVRTRTEGVWSGWEVLPAMPEALADEAPDPGTVEAAAAAAAPVVGTSPLWVGEGADAVDVRVAGAHAAAAQELAVDLIDPGASPSGEVAAASVATEQGSAQATALATPSIIRRSGWGADESLRCGSSGSAGTLKAAVVHHTAGTNSYTKAQSDDVVRGIYAYHTKTLGWCDVGYNFLVDKYGQVFEGRYGGIDKAIQGAHAGGFNKNTFGISMMGNYDVVEPPAAALQAMASVIAWKFSLAGINPSGRTTLTSAGGSSTKYGAGTALAVDTVTSHGIVSGGYTACPGRYLAAKLGALRTLVVKAMASTSATTPVPPPAPSPTAPWVEATWMLRDRGGAGAANRTFGYGSATDVVLSCDWNGDGVDGVAVFDPRSATWYLRDSASGGAATRFQYGAPGWTPVCGDWDGDGDDNIGVYDPATATWHLRRWNDGGLATYVVQFGFGGGQSSPVVGDWDGSGRDGIGVYRRSTGTWYVRQTASAGGAQASFQYGWDGATPVPGDWDGDGRDTPGVYADGHWMLRDALSGGKPGRDYWYGGPRLRPVVGSWAGAKADGTGVAS